jgi:hypothetical protein
MKQVNIRLEEELIMKMKIKAITEGISQQELIKQAIESYIDSNIEIKQPIKLETKQAIKVESEQPSIIETKQEDDDSNYYILRKTHKQGKPEKEMRQLQKGPLVWMVLEGCKAHYDENGESIPFRFTGDDGVVYEPDTDDLKEIEEAFGKPVKIES